MATTLTLNTPLRLTVDATAGNLEAVTVPIGTRKLLLRFIGDDGKLALTGTDGAAIGTAYLTIDGDQLIELDVPTTRGGATTSSAPWIIYLAHDTNSGVCELEAVS